MCLLFSTKELTWSAPPLFILFLYRRRKHLFLSTLLVLLDSVKPLKRDTIVSDGNNISRAVGKVGATINAHKYLLHDFHWSNKQSCIHCVMRLMFWADKEHFMTLISSDCIHLLSTTSTTWFVPKCFIAFPWSNAQNTSSLLKRILHKRSQSKMVNFAWEKYTLKYIFKKSCTVSH